MTATKKHKPQLQNNKNRHANSHMSDKRSHLRYNTKLIMVYMAFHMRGGTYKWTPIMCETKGSLELNSEKPIKIS